MADATETARYWTVGEDCFVVVGENTNGTKRENVPAVVVGCRGMIVVVNRTDPGRYHGEGLWAFTSDLLPLDEAASESTTIGRSSSDW